MKKIVMVLASLAFALYYVAASAVPPGQTVTFNGGRMGDVVFSGKVHADAGLKCTDCHTKIFPMKIGGVKFTMSDINAGRYCGTCHNGQRAFKANEPANCTKCHK